MSDHNPTNSVRPGNPYDTFHQIPHLLYLYDLNLNECVFVNLHIERMLGYNWPHLQTSFAQVFTNFVHPADLPRLTENRANVSGLADGDYMECEIRIRHQDGNYHDLQVRETVHARDASGKPTQLMGIGVDITEHARTERALAVNEAGFNHVIEKALVGICVTDDRGIFEYANPIYLNIYGYTADEIIGKSFTILAPSPDRHLIWQEIHDAFIAGEEEMAGEWIVKGKDGKLRIVSTDAVRYTDKHGRYKKFTFVQDVTPLRNTERALEDSQTLNRAITDQSLIGISFLEPQHFRFTDANAYYLQLLGYSLDELTKRTIFDITRLNADALRLQLETLQQTRLPLILEAHQKRKDGKQVYVKAELILVTTHDQPVICVVTKDIMDAGNDSSAKLKE